MDEHQKYATSKAAAAFLFAVAASVLGGCAALEARPPEEILKARSQQRWNAVVKGDLKAAYEFLSPGSRAVMTSEGYASSLRAGFWKAAEVEKVVCEVPATCDVHVRIEYEFRGSRIKTPLKETWIQEGSNWWYVQK